MCDTGCDMPCETGCEMPCATDCNTGTCDYQNWCGQPSDCGPQSCGPVCEVPGDCKPCDTNCYPEACNPCDYRDPCDPCDPCGKSSGKRERVKNWFKNKFDNDSSCSSSDCGDCDYQNWCGQAADCGQQSCGPVCSVPACPPKTRTKTCYKTVTQQVKVPCKKMIKVPKQITLNRCKVVTECVPTTKKVWKRVEVCGSKTVKRPVKEAYCKTVMVPKIVTGCKTVNVSKKVPYTVCYTERVACKPVCKTTCETVKCPELVCPAPVCQDPCQTSCGYTNCTTC